LKQGSQRPDPHHHQHQYAYHAQSGHAIVGEVDDGERGHRPDEQDGQDGDYEPHAISEPARPAALVCAGWLEAES